MDSIRIIAFTHHRLELPLIGTLHLDDSKRSSVLKQLKNETGVHELVYLSTCNRVEFMLSAPSEVPTSHIAHAIVHLVSSGNSDQKLTLLDGVQCIDGKTAVSHLFSVASSLDSLVVGEREIITQVRIAFERSRADGLTGDIMQVLFRKTIETAKKVFSDTKISARPVSVVSLAYRQLRDRNLPLSSKILVIGSGKTNTTLVRMLHKHGYKNFTIFNRTIDNARVLASEIGGSAHSLYELATYSKGFELLLTCTASAEPVITETVYRSLLQNDLSRKTIVDLAIPSDIDPAILQNFETKYIGVEDLKITAAKNLKEREGEVDACKKIIDTAVQEFEILLEARMVEIAMKSVPDKVREIRKMATETVFIKEIEQLDDASKKVLNQVLEYMEKKYISVPMKLAREIILENKTGVH
jgi:glutamyl-tRNA reductase